MAGNWFRNSKAIAYTALTLIILAAVACGSAAAPADTAPAVPAAAEQVAVPAPDKAAAPASPTAVPKVVSEPAMVEVHPGKVTWMTSNFGSERFDIIFDSGGAGRQYAELIHGFMIDSDMVDGKRQMVPGIVTKWELSSDALTWNLTVGKGAKFHDGTDLTAEDVTWTLRHVFGPENREGRPPTTWDKIIAGVEQPAPDQVSVITTAPTFDFTQEISEIYGGWRGGVYPKRATFHSLEDEAAYDRNPIGAGILQLVNHESLSLMAFERFDDYYHQPKNGYPTDKRVKFSAFDFRLVPEESIRSAALRAGAADFAPVSLASRKQLEAGGARIVYGQEGAFFWILWLGCWDPQYPCSDIRVRQALQYALDKELIRDQLYGGPEVMQVKGWAWITPTTLGYSPGIDPFPFEPDKARQLLAEAGYPGGKGFGKVIINTHFAKAVPYIPESAELAADMWKRELGLDVEVRVTDFTALKKQTRFTEDLHGQLYWRDNDTRPDGSKIVRPNNYWSSSDATDKAHEDPELTALSAKTNAILDPVQREKALIAAYQRFRDEAYWFGLGYINIPWGVGPRVLTWEPYPVAFHPSALHTITLK